jgi:hypothetical protein
MIDRSRAARRGFLGSLIAAVGVALWPVKRGLVRVHWDTSVTQPGASARLQLRLAGAHDGARATVVVVLRTPRETLRWDADEIPFVGDEASLDVPLDYPYPGRVPGEYRYDAEVRVGALRGRTHTSVRYRVGAASWFA